MDYTEVEKDEELKQKIMDLIQNGEDTNIEFKHTLKKSIDAEIPPSVIENNVLKSIAGFCNAKGGKLIIGVNDHKEIKGIEEDDFKTTDDFLGHLKNIIRDKISPQNVFDYINTDFVQINGKTVCLISCEMGEKMLTVKFQGKSNLYYRKLESTELIEDPTEIIEISKKFII